MGKRADWALPRLRRSIPMPSLRLFSSGYREGFVAGYKDRQKIDRSLYWKGYFEGINTERDVIRNKSLYSRGYEDAKRRRQPVLDEGSYLVGYVDGAHDSSEKRMKGAQ